MFTRLTSQTHQPQFGLDPVCVPRVQYSKRSVLWLIDSKLIGLLTAKCWLGSGFQIPNNVYYHMTSQLCVHVLSIGPSRWRWFPVPCSSSASNDDLWWWASSQEALCASLYATGCTRTYLITPKITKISWGTMPPDPLRLKSCRAAMFSTSANNFAHPSPQIKKLSSALEKGVFIAQQHPN